MNLLDIGLIALLSVPALVGVFKGIVNVATTFVGIWAAFLVAPLVGHVLTPPLEDLVGEAGLAQVLGYGTGFIATILVAGFVGWLISRSLKKLDLQWANRLAGLGLGFASGVLLAGVVVAAVQTASPGAAVLQDSVLAPPIGTATRFLIALAPAEPADAAPAPTDPSTAEGAVPAPADPGEPPPPTD